MLLALLFFSLIPSLILLGAGTYLLARVVELHTSAGAWEQVRQSGQQLLELARSAAGSLRALGIRKAIAAGKA